MVGRGDEFMIKNTKKCSRCGLKFPSTDEDCVHCHHLNDKEFSDFKEQLSRSHSVRSSLGIKLFISALIIFILLLLS